MRSTRIIAAGILGLSLAALKPPKFDKAADPVKTEISNGGIRPVYILPKYELKKGQSVAKAVEQVVLMADLEDYLKHAGVVKNGVLTKNFTCVVQEYQRFEQCKREGLPFVVVNKGDTLKTMSERLLKQCPKGAIIRKFDPKILIEGKIIATRIKYDFNKLNSKGISEKSLSEIKKISIEQIGLTPAVMKLFENEKFKSMPKDNQEIISGIISSINDKKNYVKLDEICTDLNSILENRPGLLDKRSLMQKSIGELLLDASKTEFKSISKVDFICGIIKALNQGEKGIYQGNKGTCAISAGSLGLIEKFPAEFVQMTCDLFKHNRCDLYITEGHYIRAKVTNHEMLTAPNDKDSRDPFNRISGNFMMELANGESTNYNPVLDRHEDLKGNPLGCGLGLDKLGAFFRKILLEDFDLYTVDKDTSAEALNRACKLGPVISSIKWRKHSNEEIERDLKLHGGTRETQFDADGYGYHAIDVLKVDPATNEIYFRTTWSKEGHEGDRSAPMEYVEGSIVKMSYSEFQDRNPRILAKINPFLKSEAASSNNLTRGALGFCALVIFATVAAAAYSSDNKPKVTPPSV